MRQILSIKEQADCEKRGAERAKDVPDRSAAPQYKQDYFEESQAALERGVHPPIIGCVLTSKKIKAPRNTLKVPFLPCILVPPGPDIMNVDLPGAGPKPPEPTLKDLGLGG